MGEESTEERQKQIKEEIGSESQSLTSNDRQLLKQFLGYSGWKNGRAQTKTKASASYFVKNSLFPKGKEEEEEKEDIGIEEILNSSSIKEFPPIFLDTEKKDDAKKFLEEGGCNLSSREECAIIRSFQVGCQRVSSISAK